MDEKQIKVALAVMNLTVPVGQVWCAVNEGSSELGRHTYGIQDGYRFYLVPDDSPLLIERGVISVTRVC